MPIELPELQIASTTQSEETIAQLLKNQGYDVETQTYSDQPQADTKQNPPAEVTPAGDENNDTTNSSVPSGDGAGDNPAGDAGQSESGADSEPAQTATTTQEPAKPTGSRRKNHRITKLQSELDQTKAELEEIRKKLASQDAGSTDPSSTTTPAADAATTTTTSKADEDPEPQPDQFEGGEYDPKYQESHQRWVVRDEQRKLKEKAEADNQAKADAETRERQEAAVREESHRWDAQVETARERYDDYDEVMKTGEQLQVANTLVSAVRAYENGPDLGYYLIGHPEELDRINQLVVFDENAPLAERQRKFRIAYRELDKITEQMNAAGAQPQPPAKPAAAEPQAPPAQSAPAKPQPPAPAKKPTPPETVGSRGTPTSRRVEDYTADELRNMDPEEYRRLARSR